MKYYVGLDMGSSSVGWAVTNDHYELLRKHGKDLWGVRLFEDANTAKERRTFRTARRRLYRRNWRIQVLQELFSAEIAAVDPGFFLRMKESKYYPEDKRDSNGECPELPYALFVDANYTDKQYHQDFPTIYHLRKWLMYTEETPDIRLVYLALHHMMKHRGHFLMSGNISEIKNFRSTFNQFLERVKAEELDWNIELSEENIENIENVLKDRNKTRSAKKAELVKLLKAKSNCEKAILTLLSGGTIKLSALFSDKELDECEKPKISFMDSTYEEYTEKVEDMLGERYSIIAFAKTVYDWSVLVEILGDYESISEAKISIYEKHAKDLQLLKELVKKYLTKEEYRQIFVDTEKELHNYCAYIGMTKKNGVKMDLQSKKCSKTEFYDFLRKNIISKIPNEPEMEKIQEDMEKGTFLPKQVNTDNGVIPYQVHKYELIKILENLEKKSAFICENKEKIIQLFEFKIPYYVGPLNKRDAEDDSKNTWSVRMSNDPIYPWNFEQIIDVEKSAEAFKERITGKCTYLWGENVLPKDSLLYSKFMVLNELNNLRLNGEKISVELKQRIYTEVFRKNRKVTQKKLIRYLVREKIADKNVEVTGIDGDFKTSLTAYHDFKEKLTGIELNQNEKENIILNIVIFGEDKKLLKNRIEKLYPFLTETQINSLCALSYKGWGRLSKTFLEEIYAPAPETGEKWNLITALWETNDNLMKLLGKEYEFFRAVDEFNQGEQEKEISYNTINKMQLSSPVKRQVWQTFKVLNEIRKEMGGDPDRIFVEMAREKQESVRTTSRKKQLLELYKNCKDKERDWIKEINAYSEAQFRNDRLYLYFLQKGRCMYTGEPIDDKSLWDNTKCDIDHIYPKSKTMDNHLDNRVLVKKTYNKDKSDVYPLQKSIQKKMLSFWKELVDNKFITREKFARLIREDALRPDELAGFIERQLVETRQSTKAVTEILKTALPTTEIVYVKAGIVSRFRQDQKMIKVRELNDLHHAKDAYLNIVVGNVYYTKFTKDAVWFVKTHPGRSYNLDKMFDFDIKRKKKTAWIAGEQGSIVTVTKVMRKNNALVTRKSYEAKGGLFDQQIMKKGKGQIPIKGSDERLADIEKYGGYNKAAGSYFMLVSSRDKKGREIRTIEFVPVYLKQNIEKDESAALRYLEEHRKLTEPHILLKKIKLDTLFDVDGFRMWLSGRTGNQLIFKGANQLVISDEDTAILKKVLKYVLRKKENKNILLTQQDKIAENDLIKLYDLFLDKLQHTLYSKRLSAQSKTLLGKRENFLALSKEDQCCVLAEILHMFRCQSTLANLKAIGGPANAGKLALNNNITGYDNIAIIHQSVTGIYEKRIDLLKV